MSNVVVIHNVIVRNSYNLMYLLKNRLLANSNESYVKHRFFMKTSSLLNVGTAAVRESYVWIAWWPDRAGVSNT